MALTLSGSGITSANIVDGTITNTDINASANIPASKLSGTGKVLQVIETSSATDVSTTSTSLVDSGHSISITPSSTSSEVFVQMTFNSNVTANSTGLIYALYRGSTKIGDTGIAYATTAGANTHFPTSLQHLDSPSSTSSVTYKLYIGSNSGGTVRLAGGWGHVRISAMEVAQ